MSIVLFAFLAVLFKGSQSHLHGSHHHHDNLYSSHQRAMAQIDTNSTTFKKCGTKPPTDKEKAIVTEALSTLSAERIDAESIIVIETYFHVIHDGEMGYLTDEEVNSQVSVLNERYADYSFAFELKGIDRTDNALWFNETGFWLFEIFSSLHKGGKSTLNLYSTDLLNYNITGLANYPWDTINYYEFADGAFLDYRVLPGGSFMPYNLGMVAVHEVGHWLGLFETFGDNDGTCDPSPTAGGDFVSDTPAEAYAAYSCADIGRDTCPELPGLDPVTNYMDYTEDKCVDHFTAVQQYRMHALWNLFRNETSPSSGVTSAPVTVAPTPILLTPTPRPLIAASTPSPIIDNPISSPSSSPSHMNLTSSPSGVKLSASSSPKPLKLFRS